MNKITNYCKNCDAWCCYDGVFQNILIKQLAYSWKQINVCLKSLQCWITNRIGNISQQLVVCFRCKKHQINMLNHNQLTIVVIWVMSIQVLFHFYLVIDSRLTNLIKKLNSYRVKNKRTVIIDVIVNWLY